MYRGAATCFVRNKLNTSFLRTARWKVEAWNCIWLAVIARITIFPSWNIDFQVEIDGRNENTLDTERGVPSVCYKIRGTVSIGL